VNLGRKTQSQNRRIVKS